MKKLLLAGESWMSYTTHVKGFDAFYTSAYETGEKWLKAALEEGGWQVDFLPNHEAGEKFPFTMDALSQYSCVILSDIGSNTLLLPEATFARSERKPNRCVLIRDYVLNGGALLMVGGYLTFTGVDAKGRWGMTPVQEVLPVKLLPYDDRMEHPEGVYPEVVYQHEALNGVPVDWPWFLGYNRSEPADGAEVPVTICGDPLIAFKTFGKGRSAVFASDCAPHWGPPEFVNWAGYGQMWRGIVDYIVK